MSRKALDLIHQRFGRLLVLGRTKLYGKLAWECLCDCGNKVVVPSRSLAKGRTRSCKCFWQDRMRKPFGCSLRNQVLAKYKRGAKTAGREWKLSEIAFDLLVQSKCHYCGTSPMTMLEKAGNFGSFTYNGIDRVDNAEGYTIENTVPCCQICNWAKSTMSYREFLAWLDRVSKKEGDCWRKAHAKAATL